MGASGGGALKGTRTRCRSRGDRPWPARLGFRRYSLRCSAPGKTESTAPQAESTGAGHGRSPRHRHIIQRAAHTHTHTCSHTLGPTSAGPRARAPRHGWATTRAPMHPTGRPSEVAPLSAPCANMRAQSPQCACGVSAHCPQTGSERVSPLWRGPERGSLGTSRQGGRSSRGAGASGSLRRRGRGLRAEWERPETLAGLRARGPGALERPRHSERPSLRTPGALPDNPPEPPSLKSSRSTPPRRVLSANQHDARHRLARGRLRKSGEGRRRGLRVRGPCREERLAWLRLGGYTCGGPARTMFKAALGPAAAALLHSPAVPELTRRDRGRTLRYTSVRWSANTHPSKADTSKPTWSIANPVLPSLWLVKASAMLSLKHLPLRGV